MEDKIKELGLLLGKANKLFEEIQNTPTNDPSPNPQFEVGKVYKEKNNPQIIWRCTDSKGQRGVGYGFDFLERWTVSDNWYFHEKTTIEATEKEWEQALVKEAERKYKIGDKIKSLGNYSSYLEDCLIKKFDWKYFEDIDSLQINGCELYRKGQWAEIIKEEVIKIGGYNLKVEGDVAVFGCKKFTADELTELKHIMHENDFKTVQFDKYEPVNLSTINSILNKLK